jgi:hypothetical protein
MSGNQIPTEPFRAVAKRAKDSLAQYRNTGVDVDVSFSRSERRKLRDFTINEKIVRENLENFLGDSAKVLYVFWETKPQTRFRKRRHTFIKVTIRPLI